MLFRLVAFFLSLQFFFCFFSLYTYYIYLTNCKTTHIRPNSQNLTP
uniref:Uncharacterized protein n=1 Tax=Rhizophora mucronata TaxID=61149 RepID=A0A2P2R4B3_RHIMU